MKRRLIPILLNTVAFVVLSISAFGKVPVILDTDIGTDIDDTWALAQALRSPEIDLKMVVTDTGDTSYRTALVAKFLEVAGRTEIPIGTGLKTYEMNDQEKNMLPWLAGYDVSKFPGKIRADGISAMIELIMASPEPITIVAIGAVPNLAAALKQEPRIAAKCRFVGMHGSFRMGYGGVSQPAAESNVKVDPAALRVVLAAPWRDILLTPLDTCGLVGLKDGNYHAIWSATADPILRAVIENYCIFAPRVRWMRCDWFAVESTTLFDCAAVYLSHAEKLVDVETLTFAVTDDGFTREDPKGPFKARVATRWKDRVEFEKYLTATLLKR